MDERQSRSIRPDVVPWHVMFFFFQAEDGIRDVAVTGVQTCALPISFREATWDEALELTAQELLRLKGERGPASLACFSSAKCSNEENYLMMRMFRAALGTNNIDHCTRLCHSTSVAAMQRALNTSAASGSMRE